MSLNKERIAIVSTSFPPLGGGGVSSSHYNLFSALKERGYNVHGFTFGDGEKKLLENEEGIIRYGLPPLLIKMIHLFIFIVLRVAGEKGNLFQLSDALAGAIAGFFLSKNIRKFNPQIMILPDHGAPGAFIPKIKGCKTILISHHNPIRFVNEPLFGVHSQRDSELAIKVENLALSKADGVICPSLNMKDFFSKTYSFNGPVDVIPNLLDTEMIKNIGGTSLHAQTNLSKDAPIVYVPSAGSVYKGSSFVVEIIRRLASDYHGEIGFYLSGDIGIELARSLEFLPANAHLITPGKVSYSENIGNIKSCALCVSPTLIESFGMALLESQACGIPVVAFDAGGNRSVVNNGKTGYIVPFADVEKLISYAKKLLFSEELRTNYSINALSYVRENFSEEIIIEKFLDFSLTL